MFHESVSPAAGTSIYGTLYFQDVIAGLEAKNHVMDANRGSIAVVQSIHNTCGLAGQTEEDCIHAVSDGRKSGVPDGY